MLIRGDERFYLPREGYEVSDHGRVRARRNGRILRQNEGIHGYPTVNIYGHTITVHRLVASTFIANNDPDRLIFVDHRDGDKTNSRASNLRWVTPQENTRFNCAIRKRAYRPDIGEQHLLYVQK